MLQQELELRIRNELVRYLAGEIQLNEFRQWFDAESWNSSSDLAADVDRLFAEYSNGDWTEEELHRKLAPIGHFFTSNLQTWGDSESSLRLTTGSSSIKIGLPGESPESTVDIQLAEVF